MPKSPRKRPTRETVRAKILAAAEEEFTRSGYASTKLDDVAERAGFTRERSTRTSIRSPLFCSTLLNSDSRACSRIR